MPVPTSLSITGFDINAIDDASFSVDSATVLRAGKAVHRAGAALPQSTAAPIFTVTGGLVAAVIVGRVTTVIQTQANNTQLVANPASGATDVALCAVLSISADAVGDVYAITGTLADAMVGAGAACAFQAKPVIVPAGTIDLSCAASNSGAIEGWCFYFPLEAGATVTAA